MTDLEQAESEYLAARKRAQALCARAGHEWQIAEFPATDTVDAINDSCKRCWLDANVRYVDGRIETLSEALTDRDLRIKEVQRLCTANGHVRANGSDAIAWGSSRYERVKVCTRCFLEFVREAFP